MDYSKQFEILNQKVQQIKRQQPVNYTQFSIKNIESTFDKIGKFDSINKELQDRILQTISLQYYNLIVKFVENSTLVHIQFGQPLGQLASRSAELNVKNITEQKPEVKMLMLDVQTGKVVSQFDILLPIAPYVKHQKQHIIDDIHALLEVNNQKQDTRLPSYWIPYGITFQCIYSNGSWIMATPSLQKINDATFGSNSSFQTVIEAILAKKGIKLDSLDKSVIYTLHVAIKNLSFIPVEDDQIYIYNIQQRGSKQMLKTDCLWTLIPHIKESYVKFQKIKSQKPINVQENAYATFDGHQNQKQAADLKAYIHKVLFGYNSQFNQVGYEYNVPVPMQSLIVMVGSKQYEIMTPVKELIVNFNVYRKNQGPRTDTHVQFDEYLQQELTNNTKNSYIQNYLINNMKKTQTILTNDIQPETQIELVESTITF